MIEGKKDQVRLDVGCDVVRCMVPDYGIALPKGSLSLLVDEEEEKELGFVCPWSVLYRYTGPCGEGEMYVWYHRVIHVILPK